MSSKFFGNKNNKTNTKLKPKPKNKHQSNKSLGVMKKSGRGK